MYFTTEKLGFRLPEIIAAAVRASQPITTVETIIAPGSRDESAMAPAPASDDPGWRVLPVGAPWGGAPDYEPGAPQPSIGWGIPESTGGTHWLRATLQVPPEWQGGSVFLTLFWEGKHQGSLEGIVYLDGVTLAGLDEFHRSVLLPSTAHSGEHELLIRCYTPYNIPFGGLALQLRDETIFRYAQALRAGLGAHETYQDSDPAKHALLQRLNNSYRALDIREGYGSESFAASVPQALTILTSGEGSVDPQHPAPTVVSTGHAHLDTAWLWPLWRTHQKIAHTVANALHLMERYPDYVFSLSQPQVYDFLKHDDPALYARLKEKVAEGRIEPVGMMWIEPDCNVTGGESLVRQLIHGSRFFNREFGEKTHIVWLPDVFGYSAALPQLLRGVGISCFMTTKISWNQFNRMPCDTFRWRGIDGTEVLTHFVTATDQPLKSWGEAQFYTYNGMMNGGEVFGTWNHYRQKNVSSEVLYIYGYGDGGGGPTEDMLEAAEVYRNLPGFPQVKLGRVDQFFEKLYNEAWGNPLTPTWVGELYLEYHRGTYTSQARTKWNNRHAELLFREAEWLNAWATTLGASSQQETLDKGWETILLNQFHDILPGSSVPQVYIDSNAQFARVHQTAEDVLAQAATTVIGQAASGTDSTLAVLNTLGWDRQELVHVPAAAKTAALDSYPSQLVESLKGEAELLVEIAAPSFGYTLATGSETSAPATTLRAERNLLENDELRVTFDEHGEIASLFDKRAGREVVKPGSTLNQLVLYEDRPMRWEAWDIDIFYEEKPYPWQEVSDIKVVEEGPVRVALQITRHYGQSTITQRVSLARGSRRLDFETTVDWQERQLLLRALFPLNLNTDRATCEIQFGSVERPSHRNTSWDVARFEVCAHRWVDMGEDGYGVALLNNGKYGHSLHDSTIGLSLLKGAIFPDKNADRGTHFFTYSLYPHSGNWREAQVVRRAYELNAPLRIAQVAASNAPQASFASTPNDNLVVETIKVAADGDGLIVRLYEAHNRRGQASIRFASPVKSAVETDLLENERGPVTVDGNTVSFELHPYEVKTLRVRL